MIKLVNKSQYFELFNDYAALKIKALVKSYGFGYVFCNFWVQFNENNQPTALISLFYKSATISYLKNADLGELEDFIEFLGPNEICCKADSLKIDAPYMSVNSMSRKSDRIATNFLFNGTYAQCKKIYDIFKGAGDDINIGDFNSWYLDLNHRVRHNSAAIFLEDYGGAVILTDGKDAIINGIAIKDEFKNSGNGKELINKICKEDTFDDIYVLCSNSVAPFYEKCGFKFKNKYWIYNL